ncbi:hypothetical protein BpJC7_04560 [Weizmannia acidilactici]|uniref:Uncharacterized protein n=1 Tax=Weizmannia acidilactici TaxID=2607726 RepID=A0A5J4JB75_9BACI|nr:BofC C-terminal domain-containing protein [Weizmannia acidilactici]GER66210.1 hypothetical protein BpJC4_06810 [Weizmannia acidilactici]GER69153.1 hypothetical protein BpJC7_04560 [Weizmannia acidilactici]GER72150.1 hypothetical protein BpPP18_02170 [Weizmannia acidilactici]
MYTLVMRAVPIAAFLLAGAGFPDVLQSKDVLAAGKKTAVILERVYLDGEVSEEFIRTDKTPCEVVRSYPGWQIADIGGSRIVLQKHIHDISPLLKANGYFSITFQSGSGKKGIVQPFFQLYLKKLESRRQEKMENGNAASYAESLFGWAN